MRLDSLDDTPSVLTEIDNVAVAAIKAKTENLLPTNAVIDCNGNK